VCIFLGAASGFISVVIFAFGLVEFCMLVGAVIGGDRLPMEGRRLYGDYYSTSSTSDDWEQVDDGPGQAWYWLEVVIQLTLFVGICLVWRLALFCHWSMFIKPSPTKYVPLNAVVPEDLKGQWKYGVFECCGDLGTCCCFCWCEPCMVSDLWYRSGWLHAAAGVEASDSSGGSCPGGLFYMGVGGYCLVLNCFGCCLPCGLAVLRGGAQGRLGNIVPHQQRFDIPHFGISTFAMDTLLWCFCRPCVGTQEYRQVMALLERGPAQQMAAESQHVEEVLVGAPVQVSPATQPAHDEGLSVGASVPTSLRAQADRSTLAPAPSDDGGLSPSGGRCGCGPPNCRVS